MTIVACCTECDFETRVKSVKEVLALQRDHQDRRGIEHLLDYERVE